MGTVRRLRLSFIRGCRWLSGDRIERYGAVSPRFSCDVVQPRSVSGYRGGEDELVENGGGSIDRGARTNTFGVG